MNSKDQEFLNSATQLAERKQAQFRKLQLVLTNSHVRRTDTNFPIISFEYTRLENKRHLEIAFSVSTELNVAGFHSYVVQADARNFAIKDWLLRHKEVKVALEASSRREADFLSCFDTYVDAVHLLASTCLLPYLTTDLWEQVPIDLAPYK